MTAIPVTVLAGYLGAGKTTLLNRLLARPDVAGLAVLVNDFGAINIDEQLVVSREGSVLGIAGGCVCCSYGSDLVGALRDLAAAASPPRHVVIETSGVALPRPVAGTAGLVPGLAPGVVAVVVDATRIEEQARDRFLADTVRRQVEQADALVLSNSDRATRTQLLLAEGLLRAINPDAPLHQGHEGTLLTGDLLSIARLPSRRPSRAGMSNHVAGKYESFAFEADERVDVDALARRLAAARLLRAKGVLRDQHGDLCVLHVVGRRYRVQPLPSPAGARTGLVCIARRDATSAATLRDLVAGAHTG